MSHQECASPNAASSAGLSHGNSPSTRFSLHSDRITRVRLSTLALRPRLLPAVRVAVIGDNTKSGLKLCNAHAEPGIRRLSAGRLSPEIREKTRYRTSSAELRSSNAHAEVA